MGRAGQGNIGYEPLLSTHEKTYPDEDPFALEVDVRDGKLAGKRHVDVWECKFECEIVVVSVVCTSGIPETLLKKKKKKS